MTKKKIIIIALILAVLAGLFYYLNATGQTIKIISQNEAETVSGIQSAAKDAKIKILEEQAKEAADLIKELKNKPAEYVVKTTVAGISATAENERKKNNADFSIITKPDNPDYKFDINDFEPNDPVVLNQYNIKAYKKKIIGITYYPDKYAGIDYSKRVSKSGHYLGVAMIQDLKDNKSYFGIRYTF
ncbi:hypothetical protein LJC10_00405 [Selenomonadales bacterium OttesenSCG-928-I06]|nr:hypothetical protein [Selenomonadales bacterium OttesenSCG-928-I06]